MKTKIITGVVLALVAALLLWLDIAWLWILIATIAALVGYYEAHKLLSKEDSFAKTFGALIILVSGVYALFNPIDLLAIALASTLLMAGLSAYFAKDFRTSLAMLYGYCGVICLLDIYLFRGVSYLLWLIICVVVCDSAAYFVGKAIGRRKFSDSSPNKTLEGCVGGLIAALICGSVYASLAMDAPISFAIFSSFTIALFGVFGDLFESRLKRLAGLKDSGSFLPGHGGVLDRLDALIFAAALARVLF